MAHSYPERIFVRDRDPGAFRGWLDKQKGSRQAVLEVGIGTGHFLLSQARKRPDDFFLGVEAREDRIFKAYRRADEEGLSNLSYLQGVVQDLPKYELPKFDEIYMLFPDPWPKDRHAGRRMMSEDFLKIYRSLLTSAGHLILKTDNKKLFEYSLQSFRARGWELLEVDEDFHSPEDEQTAYEKIFIEEGLNINYLKARALD